MERVRFRLIEMTNLVPEIPSSASNTGDALTDYLLFHNNLRGGYKNGKK